MKYWVAAMVLSIPVVAQNLPDGLGKVAVEKLCRNCHGLAGVVGIHQTKSAWETTVDEIISRGMKGPMKNSTPPFLSHKTFRQGQCETRDLQ
jgi:hypothetical protein